MAKLKLYCEHGAITPKLRKYRDAGLVELLHFPYDPDSLTKRLFGMARRSMPWREMTLPWSEYRDPWADYCVSEHYESIVSIVGLQNGRDALHLDSAYRSQCVALITRDCRDIVKNRVALERLLGLRIFHPDRDAAQLDSFILQATP